MEWTNRYSRRLNLIVAIISQILGVFGSVWAILFIDEKYTVFKIIGCSLYGILVILSLVMVVIRRKFGVEGLVRIHKDGNYSEIKKQFEKAEHSIGVIVYHGFNFLKATKKVLIEALERDIDIKILIAKEDSILLKETWELEGENEEDDRNKAWKILNEIEEEANGKTCSFRYLKFNTQIRYSLIIVDGKWAWWTPYHPGVDVTETSSFVLENKGEKSIIQECKKHFRTLWIELEKQERERIQQLEQNKEPPQ